MPNKGSMYNPTVLDHYKNPRNYGKLKSATHSTESLNQLCGDEITLYLKIADNRIKDIKFEARGCALMNAAASVLTEQVLDKNLDQVRDLDEQLIQKLLNTDIQGPRAKCIALPLQALKEVISGEQA